MGREIPEASGQMVGQKALPQFLNHPEAIRAYLYTTNQLERLIKDLKRRTKVVEVFCGPEALEKRVGAGEREVAQKKAAWFLGNTVGKPPC